MRYLFACLVLLVALFMPTASVPVGRGSVLRRTSPRHRLSHRIQAAHPKRPLNLTFTLDSVDAPVHVEYVASTQLQNSGLEFSATLSRLGRDDAFIDAERSPGRNIQVAVYSADTYEGRHVVIAMPEAVARTLQERGVSHDKMPQYIRQNVHVSDPDTGGQYQLVPGSNSEVPVSISPSTITITLSLNK